MWSFNSRIGRRNFLLATCVAGAASVTAVSAKTFPQTEASRAKSGQAGKGYERSEHVRQYYRTTLV
jgi:hypothetical protein